MIEFPQELESGITVNSPENVEELIEAFEYSMFVLREVLDNEDRDTYEELLYLKRLILDEVDEDEINYHASCL